MTVSIVSVSVCMFTSILSESAALLAENGGSNPRCSIERLNDVHIMVALVISMYFIYYKICSKGTSLISHPSTFSFLMLLLYKWWNKNANKHPCLHPLPIEKILFGTLPEFQILSSSTILSLTQPVFKLKIWSSSCSKT